MPDFEKFYDSVAITDSIDFKNMFVFFPTSPDGFVLLSFT